MEPDVREGSFWFTINGSKAGWLPVLIKEMEYIDDLKEAIKAKVAPELNNHAAYKLGLNAKFRGSSEGPVELAELQAHNHIGEILDKLEDVKLKKGVFKDVKLKQIKKSPKSLDAIRESFCKTILLYVNVPEGNDAKIKFSSENIKLMLENLINQAKEDHKPYAVDMEKVEEAQKKKLGRFYRQLPYGHNEDHVNLSMLGHVIPDKQPTTLTKKTLLDIVVDDIKEPKKKTVAMIGRSGAGKTATVIDLASKHFVIYTFCHAPHTLAVDFSDENFLAMASNIEQGDFPLNEKLQKDLNNVPKNDDTSRIIMEYDRIRKEYDSNLKLLAANRIRIEFLARHLFLIMLLSINPNLPPMDFFREQISGGGTKTIWALVNKLKEYDAETISSMLLHVQYEMPLPKDRGLVIALDEAQVAESNIMRGKFLSPSALKEEANFIDYQGKVIPGYTRGLLTVLCSTLSNMPATLVILGTALTLGNADHVYSAVGKENERFEKITNFPTNDENEVEDMLGKVIDMSGCTLSFEKRHMLKGRCRFPIRVVAYLCKMDHSNQNTKQQELDEAADSAIKEQKVYLQHNVKELVNNGKLGLTKDLLCRMVVASKLRKGEILFPPLEESDFVNAALCDLKENPDGYFWTMNEPMVIDVVEAVLHTVGVNAEFDVSLKFLQSILTNQGPTSSAKGEAFEFAVALALKRFNGMLLKDLPFLKDISNLPKWCETTELKVDKMGSATELGYGDGLEGDIKFFQDPPLNNMLFPENSTRPDIILLCKKIVDKEIREYWLSVAIKLYSSPLGKPKHLSNLSSSDIRECFLKSDGSINTSVKAYRKKFQDYGYPGKIAGLLRIHLVFPSVAGGTPKSCVDKQDVNVYIDSSNMETFFDENITDGAGVVQALKQVIKYVIGSKNI